MKIAIIGASGTIGKAVTNLFSEQGHEVIEASRSSQPAIDIDQPKSIDAFYAKIGEVDAVVCAAGNAAFGALDTLSDEQIQLGIDSKLMGQVNMVRKGLSRLRSGGVFILTGGIFAYKPWPQTAAIAMVNGALEAFVKGAALDLKKEQRILIVHPPLVKETAAQMNMDETPWPGAANFFGFYSVFNKLSAVSGPLLFGALTTFFGTARPAVLALAVYFIVGALLLYLVDVEKARASRGLWVFDGSDVKLD